MDAQPPSSDTSPWMPFENRRRARDEKRDAVLRTAVQLFLEQGYHRATLNEVAERAELDDEDAILRLAAARRLRMRGDAAGIRQIGRQAPLILSRLRSRRVEGSWVRKGLSIR